MWCFFGIILCSFLIVYSLLGFFFLCLNNVILAKSANCFLIMGYCAAIAWLASGTVLRYRQAGILCSGDEAPRSDWLFWNYSKPSTYDPYLVRTGSLMAGIIIALYVFYGCMCCCGFCACCAVACGYRRDSA